MCNVIFFVLILFECFFFSLLFINRRLSYLVNSNKKKTIFLLLLLAWVSVRKIFNSGQFRGENREWDSKSWTYESVEQNIFGATAHCNHYLYCVYNTYKNMTTIDATAWFSIFSAAEQLNDGLLSTNLPKKITLNDLI